MERRLLLVRHGPEPLDDRAVTHPVSAGPVADILHPWLGDGLDVVTGKRVVVSGGTFDPDSSGPFLRDADRITQPAIAADVSLHLHDAAQTSRFRASPHSEPGGERRHRKTAAGAR